MSWVRAGSVDETAIAAFLDLYPDTSMFPASNLRKYGMESDIPRAVRFWLRQVSGQIVGAVGVTQAGMVFPQAPDVGSTDWAAFARLCPVPLIGVLGPTEQVRLCLPALGLADAPCQLNKDEPRFALEIADLRLPSGPEANLMPLAKADRDLFITWRSAYEIETLGANLPDALAEAAQEFPARLADDNMRLLWVGAEPVALTGFNARLPGIVQIGGVYTPPAIRGRGHARRAVALHLAEARLAGVRRAVLFAANEPAVRAYRAIGFQQTGLFSLVLFDGPQAVRHG